MTASPVTIPFVKRVGLLGDVHGSAATLTAALDFLQGHGPLDAILCTGDLPGQQGDSDTKRTCQILNEHGVLTVAGNHDRWSIENESSRILLGLSDEWPLSEATVAFLKSLPATIDFDTPRGPMQLCHGTGDDDLTGIYPGDIGRALESNHRLHAIHGEGRLRYLLAGHTHQRMVRTIDHLTIVNAAALASEHEENIPMRVSPGTALRRKNPCFSVVDFEAGFVQFYNISLDPLSESKAECFPL